MMAIALRTPAHRLRGSASRTCLRPLIPTPFRVMTYAMPVGRNRVLLGMSWLPPGTGSFTGLEPRLWRRTQQPPIRRIVQPAHCAASFGVFPKVETVPAVSLTPRGPPLHDGIRSPCARNPVHRPFTDVVVGNRALEK